MSGGVWVVSYDVSVDRQRRQLSTMLASKGFRALYSVFEIDALPREMARLIVGANELMDAGDLLLALPTCAACWRWERGWPIESWLGPGVVV